MFTGIVEDLAVVRNIGLKGNVISLAIESHKAAKDAMIGESIAINGVCLTVVKKEGSIISFELLPETRKHTNLGAVRVGEKLNLERSLKVGDRISGHFVCGHIDCIGTIRSRVRSGGNLCYRIAIPDKFMKFIALKGSVAVDGVSLTVSDRRCGTFSVYIIAHTLQNTTLSYKGPSFKVNIECDMLAKYQRA